jgi:hypothetical protein
MGLKKYHILCVFVFFSTFCFPQKYGNEWVKFNQTYFKFPVLQEGIYRIDSTSLASKFNLSNTNPQHFQIFLKGKELPLFIKGESDGQINSEDYIEFYANSLRGEYDSLLYADITYMPNPYRAFFNDTIYAYITLNNSLNNKRFLLETDTAVYNYPLGNYVYSEKLFHQSNSYNYVQDINNSYSDPRYTQSEGYGFIFGKGASATANFGNLSVFQSSVLPCYLKVNYSGSSMNMSAVNDHQIRFSFTDAGNNTVALSDSVFYGYRPVQLSYTLSNQQIGNNSSFSLLSVNNSSFAAFNNSTHLHYLHFFYPKQTTLGGEARSTLYINDATAGLKQGFIFSSPNGGPANSILAYDLTNNRKLPVTLNTHARLVVPNSGGLKKVYLCAESTTISVNNLLDVNNNQPFTNFKNSNTSGAFVIVYHPSLQNGAQAYANYRASSAGGNYQVITAGTSELYEQFGYGINKHPQAIRNFIKYLHDSLPSPPSHLLILGKGVHLTDLHGGTQQFNLVPAIGIPAADNLLTTGITNNSCLYPEIPVGRLAVSSNSEVSVYLNKVQQHEAVGVEEWRKKILHFVGGDTPQLTSLLSNYMGSYEQIVEDTLFGANVFTFKKNTTAPIQINISDSIKDIISKGSALMTFFGHGSDQNFDQAIDDPEVYNNTGKYPLVFANSCYSGNIHIPGVKSVSERFVFSNQKGSIGFLATTSIGYVSSLHMYATNFYRALSVLQYGKGIGEIAKEASFQTSLGFDKASRYTALDMTLHGDPSIRLTATNQPDYSIKNSDVSFDTKKYVDSIGIFINHKNLGKAVNDSFFVKIERFFPNNDSISFLKRIKAPYFQDSIKLYIPLDFVRGIGLNKFRVRLDQFNEITEHTKNNNATNGTVDLFIRGGDIIPVYPYKYAVVPLTSSITLKASTTDPFAPATTYKLQLDTSDKFLNPIQQTLITSSGGVIEWTVNLPYGDSAVYFWRASKDSVLPTDRFVWRESSFQTIGNKVGWSQAHFHQFKNNAYKFVSYNRALRRFDFQNNIHSLRVRNGIYPHIAPISINFFYNNLNLSSWGCAPDGWNFAVFDSISGEPQSVVSVNWPANGPGTYSNCVCVDNQILYVYSFGQNNYCGFQNWQTTMENFLNSVAPNNYVLGYTMGALSANYAQVTSYSNSLYTAFESIGSGSIRTVPDTVPIILFGKKGMLAGQANELVGGKKSDILILEDSIRTKWNTGYVASEIIGPSYKWNSLHWQLKPFDSNAGDTTILKLVGIKSNGLRDTLSVFPSDSANVLALYNYVDAAVYPYLQLVAYMKDDVNRTSPQLKRWQVLYDEAPECAINPLKGFVAINDSLQEGDLARFRLPIENIGKVAFADSLIVTYWLEDNNKVIYNLPSKIKRNNFLPGEIIYDTIAISSIQFTGNNALWMHVNPIKHPRYQKEQEQFNNIARLAFKVDRDVTNPLLDVTFDGVRILNKDLVSAKPHIHISLKDENKFLALNDTAAFQVKIKHPGQSALKPLYFANELQFTPANLPNNSCKIDYYPNFINDGIYELSVQGRDRSANRSGATEYKIQFEIKNKASVTQVMNYPNPFSTSTRFVFTLTGSEIPEVFTIQIMTISGKVVREITKEELGTIRVGRNITEYAWDGKDDFGDKLGNGVYLYKVITRLNNKEVEKFNSDADKYFVKEFGKMVIMR